VPGVSRLSTFDVENLRLILFHPERAGTEPDFRFNQYQMSDGRLRALAILLALYQAGLPDASVSLIGIEEPESALHPAAAGALFDALHEASSRAQVIASTHSADLLDRRDLDNSQILAVEMQDGESLIGPVDYAEALRQRLYTAGDLMRMNQLRPDAASAESIAR
jgi:predicted ATPase